MIGSSTRVRRRLSALLALACVALALVFSLKAESWRGSPQGGGYVAPVIGSTLALIGSLIATGAWVSRTTLAIMLAISAIAGEVSPIGGMVISLIMPPAHLAISAWRRGEGGSGSGSGGGETHGETLPPPWSGPPRVLFIGGDPSEVSAFPVRAVELLLRSHHRPLVIDLTGEVTEISQEMGVPLRIVRLDEVDLVRTGDDRYYSTAGGIIGCLLGWDPGNVASALRAGSAGIARDPTVPGALRDLIRKVSEGEFSLRSLLPGSGVVVVDASRVEDPLEAEAAAALVMLRMTREGIGDLVPVAPLPTILSADLRRGRCRRVSDSLLSELGSMGLCLAAGPDVDPAVLDSFGAILVTSRVGIASSRRVIEALKMLDPRSLDLLGGAREGEALLLWGRPLRSTLVPWDRARPPARPTGRGAPP